MRLKEFAHGFDLSGASFCRITWQKAGYLSPEPSGFEKKRTLFSIIP
jgi:hypothetical protein